MGKKITIEMTEEQAQVIDRSCEIWARLLIGQPQIIDENLPQFFKQEHEDFSVTLQRRDDFRAIMKCAMSLVFNPLERPNAISTHESNVAFAIHQVLRRELGINNQPVIDVFNVGLLKVVRSEDEKVQV